MLDAIRILIIGVLTGTGTHRPAAWPATEEPSSVGDPSLPLPPSRLLLHVHLSS